MFARVLSADCPPDRRDSHKIAKILQDQVLPVVAREQGFRSVTFYFDQHNGKLMSITLYDTEANMRKAHDDITDFRAGIIDQLGGAHLAAESFEVIASKTA